MMIEFFKNYHPEAQAFFAGIFTWSITALGAVAAGLPEATLPAAIALTIGIGIQNFPEGFAVSVPLRREGMFRLKSFWYGQLSAIVEPMAAVLGASAVIVAKPTSLCISFCCRCDDICRCGRGHSGISA